MWIFPTCCCFFEQLEGDRVLQIILLQQLETDRKNIDGHLKKEITWITETQQTRDSVLQFIQLNFQTRASISKMSWNENIFITVFLLYLVRCPVQYWVHIFKTLPQPPFPTHYCSFYAHNKILPADTNAMCQSDTLR